MWTAIEFFGLTHIIVPRTIRTLCLATYNPNGETESITNIRKSITCAECLDAAVALDIPTSV